MKPELFIFALIVLINGIFSQETSSKDVVISVKDGSEIVGRISAETDTSVTVITPAGMKMDVPRDIVLSIDPFSGKIHKGKIMRADPNRSMYLFSPSAFPIGHQKKYCRDFCLFFPSFNYGLGKNISLQAGAFWFTGMDLGDTPFVGSGKLTFYNRNNTALAAGMMYIRFPDFDDSEDSNLGSGFLFFTGTIGNNFDHFSVSAGYGFVQFEGEWEFMDRPILTVSGNKRLSNSVAFVSENWILPEVGLENTILSASFRFFGRRIAVDLGTFFTLESISDMGFVPIVNFTYHFK